MNKSQKPLDFLIPNGPYNKGLLHVARYKLVTLTTTDKFQIMQTQIWNGIPLKRNDSKKTKAYLTKRTIFGKKASNRFPIHFTSREMNKPLVILRTILHLKNKNVESRIHFDQILYQTEQHAERLKHELEENVPQEAHQWNCWKWYPGGVCCNPQGCK